MWSNCRCVEQRGCERQPVKAVVGAMLPSYGSAGWTGLREQHHCQPMRTTER